MSAEQNVVDAPTEQRAGHDSGDNSGDNGGQQYEMDENGQRVPHGMGQSKSSRRRRRKRKGKGPEAGGAEGSEQGSGDSGSNGEAGVIASVQAGAAAPAAPQNGGQNNGRSFQQNRGFQNNGGQNNGGPAGQGAAPGGTKRWKKKFRDRGPRQENPGNQQSAGGGGGFSQNNGGGFSQNNGGGGGFRDRDTHQPGNNVGGGGFKRKGGFGGSGGGGKQQQRGPRSFVGPMDHSYRAVNGNFTETPPSTIEPHGSFGGHAPRRGYQGDSQPIDYSQGRTIPIPDDAPTHIYFFIEDLFFIAKIQETARKLGVKVAFVKNDKESLATVTAAHEDERQSLIVFDLNNANAKPLTLIPKLKTKLKKTVSIIGFLSHLQGDLKAKAVEAGCNTVMPRAAFSQNLPNLLRRYGIEEVEEANYNQ
ncbi:hypothetical protein [Granulicella tundricola]|uniref:Response regulator receiver n=1 Tax=Granulicella tundricola (strain ATCC BAA-1859 / DSM 23138 / MP5ACTX9) TaxID=1198114 RepID=E8WZU6_GRATM|nr:hypothetical protein [Granulicella tundricola]ADW67757.1 hypothetical protein AciX9_0687 [Granulicella tundricola MP5ACTX9]